MNKILVSYFSASGVTKKVAEILADNIGADLFEIEPVIKYTESDLNWNNKQSRSSVEMQDKLCRPQIKENSINLNNYDIIMVGFPIWWGVPPRIINTFLESIDFSQKILIPFCISGGSGMSYCENYLKQTYPNYIWKEGKKLNGGEDKNYIQNWLKQVI